MNYYPTDDELEPEPWRPVWLTPREQQPYQLETSTDPMRGSALISLRSPRLGVACEVSRDAIESAPRGFDVVEHATNDLVRELKRTLLDRYGLHEVVRDDLYRKLRNAAMSWHRRDEQAAIMHFLAEVGALDEERRH